jgi:signal transduction histidine kinase
VIYELGHLALETRQAFFAHEVELLTTLLERAERGGQVRVHSPQEMAEVFSAFFQALERVLAAPHRIEQSLEVLDRVLTFLTLGLIATSEEPT